MYSEFDVFELKEDIAIEDEYQAKIKLYKIKSVLTQIDSDHKRIT